MRVLIALLGLVLAGAAPAEMKVELPDVPAGDKTFPPEYVYDAFGCTGENKSPAVRFIDVPVEAKSLALTMYDPDAPTGSGWWHWVVYDIPAGTEGLPKNVKEKELPGQAKMGNTDYLTDGYGGPCPPVNDKPHQYVFELFALDVAKIDVPKEASPAMVGFMLRRHAIERATAVRYHGR